MSQKIDSDLPKVAIIGRPNVGKSTLFNLLARKKKSLVKNQAGVTRDFIYEATNWWGSDFEVVDSGGLTQAEDDISKLISVQLRNFVNTFDLLIVVMDGKSGMLPEDRDVVKLAKQSGKPYLIIVNKVDNFLKSDLILSDFYEFGEDILPCAFETFSGVDEVVTWINSHLPQKEKKEVEGIRLAVVGKPNAGKSTFCNAVLNENRMLVSDIAGTTVDAVDLPVMRGDHKYILVDTAGMRRPSKRDEGVERISVYFSQQSIETADIVLLFIDAIEGITLQDARIIEFIVEQHKAVILVVNKSDLGQAEIPEFKKRLREQIDMKLHFYTDIPVEFISAKKGHGLNELFDRINDTWEKIHRRIPTSKLNNFFYDAIRKAPSPVYGTQNVKFYYLTQTRQVPPAFIAFANHPAGVTPSYRRFLIKQIQNAFDLVGIPIRIFVMGGGKEKD